MVSKGLLLQRERKKMNLTAFQRQVVRGLQARLEEDVTVEANCITKNNGVVWHGICISREGVNIAPTIYLDELYQEYCDGRTMNSILGQVLRVYEKSRFHDSIKMDFFMHYEQVKGKIVYRLVNYQKNEEMLRKMPHMRFLDLAVIFACIVMNDSISHAAVLVREEHCRMWDVNTDVLLQAAVENTPRYNRVYVKGMEEIIREMLEEQIRNDIEDFCRDKVSNRSREKAEEWADTMRAELDEELRTVHGEVMMYVMGSKNKQYGAGTILYPNVLAEFAQKKEQNFFILPCSVHEVILVPDSGKEDAGKLQQMVKEVNETQLDAEDVLSDSVYYFDRMTGKITLLCEG